MSNQNDPFSTLLVSGQEHYFYVPYDMSSDNPEYIRPANMVKSISG
jgi:hypothetical protein